MMEPEIRLKGFEGEWNNPYLKDCLGISLDINTHNFFGKEDVLSVSDEYGVVNQIKHLGRSYAGKSVSGYKILRTNQIVYTKSPLREKPFGIVKVNEGPIGIVSVLYAIYNPENGIYPKYIQRYFEPSKRINKYLLPLVNKGAKNTMNISDETALKGRISIPNSIGEQKAICDYLDNLDTLIGSSTSRLASLKQMKAASLQAMFPQEGETKPKIRFKGFEGEWEKVSFSEISFHAGLKNRDNLPLESYSISNEHGFIPQDEQFENGGTMTNADKTMYYIVSPNSFAYNPARINVGSLGYYDGNQDVIVSSLYEVFKTNEDTDDRFLLYWFKTDIFKKKIEQFQEGGVRLYFFYDKLCKCDMLRPSLAEQQAIASYFTSLDRQITLQSQRLEKLKQIKAACLDKMFV